MFSSHAAHCECSLCIIICPISSKYEKPLSLQEFYTATDIRCVSSLRNIRQTENVRVHVNVQRLDILVYPTNGE